ncbi:MAG: RNA-binding transcriptional accessory protein [Saprospiraceae bacterium]|nr:RNA-binding transcriptional accessory protein [Saprospiraceae bacterium]MBX7179938.1 RNA-binding transcriptional accessory protein [Saprospiraceae bacterium]MCB0591146.1 RNA-binding transcriptional accessory protein [Saprospiraceae bacterium]MCO6472084.1 RNA-binding transcriptional accessory protein [Saprospiraceae bacterium]HMY84177.1 Tex family protein [Saprospiraceae bacterium]
MIEMIYQATGLREQQVRAVLELIQEGATIPFIARYRKDRTGGLDEVKIAGIITLHRQIIALEERRTFILESLAEKGIGDEKLLKMIREARDLQTLEDLYSPYKSRRKTRADMARERGLEPLAKSIMSQRNMDVEAIAFKYTCKEVPEVADALQGARDIIAEWIADDVTLKASLRKLFASKATVGSKVVKAKAEEAGKYRDYFDFKENIRKIAGHRFLAISRGADEGFLRLSIEPEIRDALDSIDRRYIRARNSAASQVEKAIDDAYKRLIQPSLETEFRNELKEKADKEAIDVFAQNLRQLLLAGPAGEKCTMAIDPGYRTGCKIAILDVNGNLIATDLIYIHEPNRLAASRNTIESLIKKHSVEIIAIGDGTAGRETERFVKNIPVTLPVFLVNEDGASIYSASGLAREEFPDLDLTYRGSISIGRRLMDPLAELVKIDPKNVGVGQYQHDVNQALLKETLDRTVESCVNAVGVNLNTAGKELLAYVSGIGPVLAKNIVSYRTQHGAFRSRKELLEVPRLGPKVYQQAAGFLRIKDGENILDDSGVHPESYDIVKQISKDLKMPIEVLIGNPILDNLDTSRYQDENRGELTLKDIIAELKKPGLDPRTEASAFEFASVYSIDELYEGMILPGKVTNLTKFGAFVDIGVKQDGMVHISEIANKYIKDPADELKLNQHVMVRVLQVDKERQRISLSIRQV